VGMGVQHDRSALLGQPAPQIEDPLAPLSSRKPAPAGLGPVAPSWSPRAELCGTLDDEWRRTRAPIWPRDFDPRFYCCAPSDQWSETPLVGDEPVEIVGATPAGRWAFQLPHHEPVFTSKLRGQAERECETHLDTYLIDAGEGRVELTWRVAVPLPRKTEHLERVDLYGLGELPEDVIDDLRQRVMPRAELEAS